MSTSYVYGVRVCATDSPGPNQNQSTFTEVLLPGDHKIFNQTATPISQKLGFPLVIYRTGIRTIRTTNPRTAWLMIDPATHLAPMEWQDHVGDVVVVRLDKEPLSVKALIAFTEYLWEIIQTSELLYDKEEDMEEYDPSEFYNPGKLEAYMHNYPRSRNDKVDYHLLSR